MVLNNPISRTVLRPLDVLDVPRRAVWSTINETVDALNPNDGDGGFSFQDLYDQTNPLHVITQKGDTTFGAGDVIPEFDTPLSEGWDKWINRGVGLAGDIYGDPLTYIPIIGQAATAARTAEGLARLNRAQKATQELSRAEEAFRALGFLDEAGPQRMAAMIPPKPAPGMEDAFSALGFKGGAELPYAGFANTTVPDAVRGAMERAAALSDEADLERLGRRSLTGANAAQREAMKLGDQALQFHIPIPIPGVKLGYHNIPGTGALSEAAASAKAAVKLRGRALPGMGAVREKFAPTGILGNSLHPAYERILTGAGGGSIRPAIEAIGLDNAARQAAGTFRVVAATTLERVAEATKGQTPEARAAAVRMAEEDLNVTNEWTQFADQVLKIARYAGAELPELRNGRYVMPHVLDRGFRNHLMDLVKKSDPRAKSFMRDTGLTTEDLLEEGGFMQRRSWRPNDDGTPNTFDIGGQKVTVETGSLDELNAKIGAAFPDYDGKIYETDPVLAWRGYIQATQKDVAKRASFKEAARLGNEGVRFDPGQPQQFDPYGGRQSLPPREVTAEDGTVTQVPVEQVVKQQAPTLTPAQREVYTSTSATPSAEAATKARNKAIVKTQPSLLDEYYRVPAQAKRDELAAELDRITGELTTPIHEERMQMLRLRNEANTTRAQAESRLEEILDIELPAIQRERDAIAQELNQITKSRAIIKRTARDRPAQLQQELLEELNRKEAELIDQLDGLNEVHAARQGPEGGDAGVELAKIRAGAPERRQSRIAAYGNKLQRKLGDATEALAKARREAKYDWQGRARFRSQGVPTRVRIGDKKYLTAATQPEGYAAAGKYLQDHADDFDRWNRLTRRHYELSKESRQKIESEMQHRKSLIANVEHRMGLLTTNAAKEPYIRYRDQLIGEIRMLGRQRDEIAPQLFQVSQELATPELKAVERALEFRETHQQWLNSEAKRTGSARSRVGEYQRQLDDWNAALDAEEAALYSPTNRTEEVAEAVSPEVVKAQKYLKTEAAFNYVRDRTRLENLTPTYIKGAKDPEIIAKLEAERRTLQASLEKRAKTAKSVEAAENVIRRNGAEVEEVVEAAPVAAAAEAVPTASAPVEAPPAVATAVPRDAADPRLPASIEGAPLPPRNMEGNPLTADDMWNMSTDDPRWQQLAAFPGFDPEIAEFWARNMDTPPADMFRGPVRTPAEYRVMRNLMEDDLGRVVEEGTAAFDNIDSIYNMSDQDTDKLIAEVFDLLSSNTQTFWNLRGRVGQADEAIEAAPTQAALPPAPAVPKKPTRDYHAGYRAGGSNNPEKLMEKADAAGRSQDWYGGFHDAMSGDPKGTFYKTLAAETEQAAPPAAAPLDFTNLKIAGPEEAVTPLGPRVESNPTGMFDSPILGSSSPLDISDTSRAALPRTGYTTRGQNPVTPPVAPQPMPKHPYLKQIDSEENLMELEAKALGNPPPGGVDTKMVPQINQTSQELSDVRARQQAIAAGTDEEFNAIPAEQQAAAGAEYDELGQRREELKGRKKELNEVEKTLDAETGEHQQTYIDALEDYEKYRVRHREIADKAKGLEINRAEGRKEMTPTKKGLKEVAEGTTPSYEAQPLYTTYKDIQALIDANPTGDDALMLRMEAALHPIEQQLANLTSELDLPGREVEQIIAAARKGKLAPVVTYHMKSDWSKVWDGGDVLIRNDIAQAYHRVTKVMQDPGMFARTLLAFTNFFKTYATLTPGFHVRNGLSAIFMNAVEGVPLRGNLEGLSVWGQFSKAEDPLAWLQRQDQEVQDAFKAVFGSGAGGRYTEAGFARSTSSGRRRQTAFNNPATRLSQRVGQDWIEGPARLAMALHSIRQGDDVQAAMRRITRIHFDYSQVSEFDEKAKRLIPFWTFMSRNIPMQITEMWSRPQTYAWFNSFMRNIEGDPVEGTPEYFEQLGATPFANLTVAGMPLFLQPDLGHRRVETDISDLENMLSGGNLSRPLTNLNPFITAVPEYIGQRDLYTGREYEDTDLRKLGPIEKLSQPVLQALGLLKTAPDGTQLVEERLPNMLQALNPLYARSASLMPNLTTGAGDDTARRTEAWARTALGLPLRTLSPQQQQNTQRSDFYRRRDDMAMQRAMMKAAGG
jgi:hypothetical protein